MQEFDTRLPALAPDGIPTPIDRMTQIQLRMFIPEMVKFSTGCSKLGWGIQEYRPIWWPIEVPWSTVRRDIRTDEEKKRLNFTEALRLVVKHCYRHHGREDMLGLGQDTSTTKAQTINKTEGTVSSIKIDPGTNGVVALPDDTKVTVFHPMQTPEDRTRSINSENRSHDRDSGGVCERGRSRTKVDDRGRTKSLDRYFETEGRSRNSTYEDRGQDGDWKVLRRCRSRSRTKADDRGRVNSVDRCSQSEDRSCDEDSGEVRQRGRSRTKVDSRERTKSLDRHSEVTSKTKWTAQTRSGYESDNSNMSCLFKTSRRTRTRSNSMDRATVVRFCLDKTSLITPLDYINCFMFKVGQKYTSPVNELTKISKYTLKHQRKRLSPTNMVTPSDCYIVEVDKDSCKIVENAHVVACQPYNYQNSHSSLVNTPKQTLTGYKAKPVSLKASKWLSSHSTIKQEVADTQKYRNDLTMLECEYCTHAFNTNSDLEDHYMMQHFTSLKELHAFLNARRSNVNSGLFERLDSPVDSSMKKTVSFSTEDEDMQEYDNRTVGVATNVQLSQIQTNTTKVSSTVSHRNLPNINTNSALSDICDTSVFTKPCPKRKKKKTIEKHKKSDRSKTKPDKNSELVNPKTDKNSELVNRKTKTDKNSELANPLNTDIDYYTMKHYKNKKKIEIYELCKRKTLKICLKRLCSTDYASYRKESSSCSGTGSLCSTPVFSDIVSQTTSDTDQSDIDKLTTRAKRKSSFDRLLEIRKSIKSSPNCTDVDSDESNTETFFEVGSERRKRLTSIDSESLSESPMAKANSPMLKSESSCVNDDVIGLKGVDNIVSKTREDGISETRLGEKHEEISEKIRVNQLKKSVGRSNEGETQKQSKQRSAKTPVNRKRKPSNEDNNNKSRVKLYKSAHQNKVESDESYGNETAEKIEHQDGLGTDTSRLGADTSRLSADTSRLSADTSRLSADTSRHSAAADTSRLSADTSRLSADTSRLSADTSRLSADTSTDSVETSSQSDTVESFTSDATSVDTYQIDSLNVESSGDSPVKKNTPIRVRLKRVSKTKMQGSNKPKEIVNRKTVTNLSQDGIKRGEIRLMGNTSYEHSELKVGAYSPVKYSQQSAISRKVQNDKSKVPSCKSPRTETMASDIKHSPRKRMANDISKNQRVDDIPSKDSPVNSQSIRKSPRVEKKPERNNDIPTNKSQPVNNSHRVEKNPESVNDEQTNKNQSVRKSPRVEKKSESVDDILNKHSPLKSQSTQKSPRHEKNTKKIDAVPTNHTMSNVSVKRQCPRKSPRAEKNHSIKNRDQKVDTESIGVANLIDKGSVANQNTTDYSQGKEIPLVTKTVRSVGQKSCKKHEGSLVGDRSKADNCSLPLTSVINSSAELAKGVKGEHVYCIAPVRQQGPNSEIIKRKLERTVCERGILEGSDRDMSVSENTLKFSHDKPIKDSDEDYDDCDDDDEVEIVKQTLQLMRSKGVEIETEQSDSCESIEATLPVQNEKRAGEFSSSGENSIDRSSGSYDRNTLTLVDGGLYIYECLDLLERGENILSREYLDTGIDEPDGLNCAFHIQENVSPVKSIVEENNQQSNCKVEPSKKCVESVNQRKDKTEHSNNVIDCVDKDKQKAESCRVSAAANTVQNGANLEQARDMVTLQKRPNFMDADIPVLTLPANYPSAAMFKHVLNTSDEDSTFYLSNTESVQLSPKKQLSQSVGPLLIRCEVCNMRFKSLSALKLHASQQNHHNENLSESEANIRNESSVHNVSCPTAQECDSQKNSPHIKPEHGNFNGNTLVRGKVDFNANETFENLTVSDSELCKNVKTGDKTSTEKCNKMHQESKKSKGTGEGSKSKNESTDSVDFSDDPSVTCSFSSCLDSISQNSSPISKDLDKYEIKKGDTELKIVMKKINLENFTDNGLQLMFCGSPVSPWWKVKTPSTIEKETSEDSRSEKESCPDKISYELKQNSKPKPTRNSNKVTNTSITKTSAKDSVGIVITKTGIKNEKMIVKDKQYHENVIVKDRQDHKKVIVKDKQVTVKYQQENEKVIVMDKQEHEKVIVNNKQECDQLKVKDKQGHEKVRNKDKKDYQKVIVKDKQDNEKVLVKDKHKHEKMIVHDKQEHEKVKVKDKQGHKKVRDKDKQDNEKAHAGKTGKQKDKGIKDKVEIDNEQSQSNMKLTAFEKAIMKNDKGLKPKSQKTKHKSKPLSRQSSSDTNSSHESNKELLLKMKRSNHHTCESVQPFQNSKIARRIYMEDQRKSKHNHDDDIPEILTQKNKLSTLQPFSVMLEAKTQSSQAAKETQNNSLTVKKANSSSHGKSLKSELESIGTVSNKPNPKLKDIMDSFSFNKSFGMLNSPLVQSVNSELGPSAKKIPKFVHQSFQKDYRAISTLSSDEPSFKSPLDNCYAKTPSRTFVRPSWSFPQINKISSSPSPEVKQLTAIAPKERGDNETNTSGLLYDNISLLSFNSAEASMMDATDLNQSIPSPLYAEALEWYNTTQKHKNYDNECAHNLSDISIRTDTNSTRKVHVRNVQTNTKPEVTKSLHFPDDSKETEAYERVDDDQSAMSDVLDYEMESSSDSMSNTSEVTVLFGGDNSDCLELSDIEEVIPLGKGCDDSNCDKRAIMTEYPEKESCERVVNFQVTGTVGCEDDSNVRNSLDKSKSHRYVNSVYLEGGNGQTKSLRLFNDLKNEIESPRNVSQPWKRDFSSDHDSSPSPVSDDQSSRDTSIGEEGSSDRSESPVDSPGGITNPDKADDENIVEGVTKTAEVSEIEVDGIKVNGSPKGSDEVLDYNDEDVLDLFADDENASFLESETTEDGHTDRPVKQRASPANSTDNSSKDMELASDIASMDTDSKIETNIPVPTVDQPNQQRYSGLYMNRWMPSGYCFSYFNNRQCTTQPCRFKHVLPDTDVLMSVLPAVRDAYRRGEHEKALWMVLSHDTLKQRLRKEDVYEMYGTCLEHKNILGSHALLKLMYQRDLVSQKVIDDFISLCVAAGEDHMLWEVFQMAKCLNIQPKEHTASRILSVYKEKQAWQAFWEVLLYLTENESYQVPIGYAQSAVAVSLEEPNLLDYTSRWLYEVDQQLLRNFDRQLLQNLCHALRDNNHGDLAQSLEHLLTLPDQHQQDIKLRIKNIQSVSYTQTWDYLAELYVDLCNMKCPLEKFYVNEFIRALSSDPASIGKGFGKFLYHLNKVYEKNKRENPQASLDMESLSNIGNELMYICHSKHLWMEGRDVIAAEWESRILSLHTAVPRHRNIAAQALQICISANDCILAKTVLNAADLSELEVTVQSYILDLFPSLIDLQTRYGAHGDSLKVLERAFVLVCTKHTPSVYDRNSLSLTNLCTSLIQKWLDTNKWSMATSVYQLYLHYTMPFTIPQTLKRYLLVALVKTDLKKESLLLYEDLKKSGAYAPQSFDEPRLIILKKFHTGPEIYMIVKDYLSSLYNLFCECVLDNKVLTQRDLELGIQIDHTGTVPKDKQMSYLGKEEATESLVKSVLLNSFEPPLQTFRSHNILAVSHQSLQANLHAMDLSGRRQGLVFQRPVRDRITTGKLPNKFHTRINRLR